MKKKCAIVYATGTGFTGTAAKIIGESLAGEGHECTIIEADENIIFESFDFYILGSPVILGKMPKKIKKWIHRNREYLEQTTVYFFWTCLRLTEAIDGEKLPFEVFTDDSFTEAPALLAQMGPMEKSHEIRHYFNPVRKEFPWLKIENGAVFKGGLEYGKLSLPGKIFMRFMSLLQKDQKEGNFVNHRAISSWGIGIGEK